MKFQFFKDTIGFFKKKKKFNNKYKIHKNIKIILNLQVKNICNCKKKNHKCNREKNGN